jgi:aconitate hydratase
MVATDPETGKSKEFAVLCRIDTPVEVDYYKNGGILQAVLRKLLADGESRKGVAKS